MYAGSAVTSQSKSASVTDNEHFQRGPRPIHWENAWRDRASQKPACHLLQTVAREKA